MEEWVYDLDAGNSLPVVEVFGEDDGCGLLLCGSDDEAVPEGECVGFGDFGGSNDGGGGGR